MRRHILPTIAMAFAVPIALSAQDEQPADGKLTFETTCIACHTLQPPAKLAPPMVMIARHYRQAFDSDSTGIAAITRWVLEPDSARSALPAHAIAKFGLMPKPAVTPTQARAVARYVWMLGNATMSEEP